MKGGRPVGRLLATLTATAVAGGLLASATPAGAISIGLGGVPLLGGLISIGGAGSFDWSTSSATPISTTQVARVIGATSMAAAGLDGGGVGVALIDTGVVPIPGLPAAQVVNGPDLSVESQAPSLRYLDGFGHGTHLAGIIVGSDPAAGFTGLAPGVKLTSIKVGTSQGAADVSQVIAALDWVVAHRNDDPANPIRVVNLAYGTNSTQNPGSDPLSFAVENAWRAGIVVVVAGGNAGSRPNRLDDPAANPYVLAVGSAAGRGTTMRDDDYISTFDSVSTGRDIDLVAPGESIISLRDPGSNIDTTYPKARVGTAFFKGSGSSQASAVVSGAVALLLQKRPDLRPDQVKALLKATATPVTTDIGDWTGVGELNLASALTKPVPLTLQSWPAATGLGSLDQGRGTNKLVFNGVALTGEFDLFGAFSSAKWAAASTTGTAWAGGQWMGHAMAGDGWTGTSWASRTWPSTVWPAGFWGAVWNDSSWSGHYWSGHYWSGDNW
jgi:serine protease AprX